jgi:hypothetical protein
MAKISRPAVYTLVGAVAVYAWFILTQPDVPVPTRKVHVLLHAAPGADDFAAADLSAHFARYQAGKRDPFLPHLPASAGLAASKAASHAEPGKWALTGISSLNGVPNALVENSVTGDSVFLKPGDRWHGLRVLSIGTDAVAFINALGQQTSLAFRPLGASLPEPGGQGTVGFHLLPLGTVSPLPVGPGNIRALPVLPPLGAAPMQRR